VRKLSTSRRNTHPVNEGHCVCEVVVSASASIEITSKSIDSLLIDVLHWIELEMSDSDTSRT
jgi:hypothetical protein